MISLLFGLFLVLGEPDTFDPENLARAEEAYRTGQYEQALTLFETALSEPDVPRGPLLYNLGNCAFRLGRQAEARFYYMRALLRMPRDQEVKFNLALLERQLDLDDPPRRAVGDLVLGLADWFTPGELLVLVLVLQAAGLAGLLFLRTGLRARLAMGLLVLLGLLGSARLMQTQWFGGPPAGVVLAREIGLRSEPHSSVPIAFKLEAGDLVRVVELSDRWVRVAHPGGGGWTERASVGVVN